MPLITTILSVLRPHFKGAFETWIYSRLRRIAFLISLPAGYSIWLLLKSKLDFLADYDDVVPVAANFIFAGVAAFIFEHRIKHPQSIDDTLARRALTRFTTYWSLVWLLWTLAYLIVVLFQIGLGLHWFKGATYAPWVEFSFDVLCNGVNFLFLIVYFILLRPEQEFPIPWNKIIIAFVIIVPLFFYKDFSYLFYQSPKNAWQLIIGGISGTISCIMLAILAGRLDSRYLRPPIWVILCLYIYAAIQVAFGFFGPVLEQHKAKFGSGGEIEIALSSDQINQWGSPSHTNKIEIIIPIKKEDLRGLATGRLETNLLATINLTPFNLSILQNDLDKSETNSLKISPKEIKFFTTSGPSINGDFDCWRSELDVYSRIIQILYVAACFFKALLFAFVLWLVSEGRLLEYFRLAIEDVRPPPARKMDT